MCYHLYGKLKHTHTHTHTHTEVIFAVALAGECFVAVSSHTRFLETFSTPSPINNIAIVHYTCTPLRVLVKTKLLHNNYIETGCV